MRAISAQSFSLSTLKATEPNKKLLNLTILIELYCKHNSDSREMFPLRNRRLSLFSVKWISLQWNLFRVLWDNYNEIWDLVGLNRKLYSFVDLKFHLSHAFGANWQPTFDVLAARVKTDSVYYDQMTIVFRTKFQTENLRVIHDLIPPKRDQVYYINYIQKIYLEFPCFNRNDSVKFAHYYARKVRFKSLNLNLSFF